MKELKQDLKRLPHLVVGLFILGVGIFLTKLSLMGMAPWGIFHMGLSQVTAIPFGIVTQIVGFLVLVISLFLFRVEIGIGTILNVLIVGPWITVLDVLFPKSPNELVSQIMIFLAGFLLMNIGRSLYISSNLGQGPRDGMFIGLARSTGWSVKVVKPLIDLTVFIIGSFLLLGTGVLFSYVGIGTLIIVLFSGYVIGLCFSLLGFHPSMAKGYSISRYIRS